MIRRPPRSTRTDTLFPYTTRFRSDFNLAGAELVRGNGEDLHPAGTAIGLQILVELAEIAERLFRGLIPCQALVEQRDILDQRSEEHTSELQSLMRTSYAVFYFNKKKKN